MELATESHGSGSLLNRVETPSTPSSPSVVPNSHQEPLVVTSDQPEYYQALGMHMNALRNIRMGNSLTRVNTARERAWIRPQNVADDETHTAPSRHHWDSAADVRLASPFHDLGPLPDNPYSMFPPDRVYSRPLREIERQNDSENNAGTSLATGNHLEQWNWPPRQSDSERNSAFALPGSADFVTGIQHVTNGFTTHSQSSTNGVNSRTQTGTNDSIDYPQLCSDNISPRSQPISNGLATQPHLDPDNTTTGLPSPDP